MDRLEAMSVFVAVCDSDGFAPAARRLGISPSAATRQINALENGLGVQLLARTTRSLKLTEAGQRYLERARLILLEVKEAEEVAQSDRATPRGRLVLSAPLMFGRMHVAKLLCKYMLANPEVVTELQLTDRMANLVEEGIDLCIRIGELSDSSLVARRLGETRRVIVASPQYLNQRGRPTRPDDLLGHRLTHFSITGVAPEWRFERAGVESRIRFTPHFVTNSGDAAIGHAIDGGGLIRTYSYEVVDPIRAGELEMVLEGYELPPAPINAVFPTSRLLSAKVRAFVDLIDSETAWRFVDIPGPGDRGATVDSTCYAFSGA